MNTDADKLAKCMAELATCRNVNAKLGVEITHVRQVNEMLRNEFRELEEYTVFLSRENEALKFKLTQLNKQIGTSNNSTDLTVNHLHSLDDSEEFSDYSDDNNEDNYDNNEDNYDNYEDKNEDVLDGVANGISDMMI